MGVNNPPIVYGSEDGQPGIATIDPRYVASVQAQTANTVRFGRIRPTRDFLIASVEILVAVAATADDPIDVGIYDANLAKLASSGAVTGQLNALGLKNIPLAAARKLVAGSVYYLAFSYGPIGAAAAQLAVNFLVGGSATGHAGQTYGANTPQRYAGTQGGAHPLPDPIVPAATTVLPFLAARE